MHPGRVDIDVVEQRVSGAGLVALGMAGRQEAFVAPPDVQVPSAGARGRQRTLFLLDRPAASQLPADLDRALST